MKPQAYETREILEKGFPLRVTSYQLGDKFLCTVDNLEPGAWLARAEGSSRQDAEEKALARARELVGRTRRFPVPPRSKGR